ncbi:MAG TPA: amidohydrolase family protein, partial [Bradyrhizobium sp.]|nr:amidohydrolase family protein [Bradyrhizobium sp.]
MLQPMKDVELRIDARWVLPIEPAGLLHQHSLLVSEGRIVAMVPTAHAERDYSAREQVALPTHVLLPGLVNAHTHAAMSLLRGVGDDVPLEAWLERSIWPREGRFVDADFVYDGTLLAAAEMLRGGVTCCNDM